MPEKKGRRMTTVSVKGDRKYIQDLAVFAKVTGEEVGELVRRAIDKVYGEKIAHVSMLTGSVHSEASALISDDIADAEKIGLDYKNKQK